MRGEDREGSRPGGVGRVGSVNDDSGCESTIRRRGERVTVMLFHPPRPVNRREWADSVIPTNYVEADGSPVGVGSAAAGPRGPMGPTGLIRPARRTGRILPAGAFRSELSAAAES